MIIAIHTKPETGNVSRTCRICGEHYTGWNFVRCSSPSCRAVAVEVALVYALPSTPVTEWSTYTPAGV